MPAKRKEETRSATDIEIDAAHEAMMRGEAAVQNCKDAMQDLAFHTARLKQLESELAPKEAEHKSMYEKFQRIVEGACVFRKQRGPGAHIAAAAAEDERARANIRSPASAGGNVTPRGRVGTAPLLMPSEHSQDEKELNKALAHASREVMMGLLQPLFLLPRTANELHNAAVLAAKIHEATVGATQADTRPLSAGAQGRVTPRKKPNAAGGGPVVPLSQQPLWPEPALLPPLGVDMSTYTEVLKLRELKLGAERAMEELQGQLKASRDTLQRRKDEGCGTKAALKKAEKDLIALTKAHNALRLKKEEEEIIKRREEANAANKKTEEKVAKAVKK